jgi:hypothetical protein
LQTRILSASIVAAAVRTKDGNMPVLIVSRHRQRCRRWRKPWCATACSRCALNGAAEALAVANVLRFKVAVFLGTIDQEATEAMRELRTRHGTRSIAVDGQSSHDDPYGPTAAFERRLPDPVTEETLLQHIRELRAAG